MNPQLFYQEVPLTIKKQTITNTRRAQGCKRTGALPRHVPLFERAPGGVRRPDDPDQHPQGHLDHGHDVPRRPAVAAALYAETDRRHLRFPAPHERPERRDPPDRVLPLFGEGPRGGAALHGAGLPLSRDHRLDHGRTRTTSSSSRRWASRKRASSPPAPTTTSS